MNDLNFRMMDKTDLPAVLRIENDCQSHPWSLLQFLDGFKSGHTGWLASREVDGSELLVGFAVVSTVLDECTLLNLGVRPACQKQGYGRNLLKYVLGRAAQDNIKKFFLEVRASNLGAIRLYESEGFERISIRRDYYPAVVGREDGLIYLLSPSSPSSPSSTASS